MSATEDPLAAIDCEVETITSFSGLDVVKVHVCRPKCEGELRTIFEHARSAQPRRRVTLRSGGHSFDAQSINTDLVVSMERFKDIHVDTDHAQKLVTVGPGASWGDILCELQRRGLVPAVTVTTSHATAGGTLAGDCLSRFSPAWGKEGTRVKSFVFLTVAGRKLDCSPPVDPSAPSTLEERIFLGAIGGLGYLGAFLSITYEVLWAAQPGRPIGVATRVHKCASFEELANELVPAARQMHLQDSDPCDPAKGDAVYSAVGPRPGKRQSLLFKSTFTDRPERKRMLLFQPDSWYRVPIELLIRWKRFNRALWWLSFSTRIGYKQDDRYVDDLQGYTFFLDGNVRAKRRVRSWTRLRLKTIQQTFIVPDDQERLVDWLQRTQQFLECRELRPTLTDVLYLPKDLPFPMSATSDMAGFAVSYAFETSRKRELARVSEAFHELADVLHKRYGGRVYLVKNVRASKETLAAMYGEHAKTFFELKADTDVDPDRVLCNEFLERTFGR